MKIRPPSLRYVASRSSVADFRYQLAALATQTGICQDENTAENEEVVVIGDGAAWIWNLADEQSPGATEIVDYMPKTLCDVAKQAFGEDGRDTLYKGETSQVVARIRDLGKQNPAIGNVLEKEVDYFQKHAHRMQYRRFNERGYQIGNGVIEAACKHAVNKQACDGPNLGSIPYSFGILAMFAKEWLMEYLLGHPRHTGCVNLLPKTLHTQLTFSNFYGILTPDHSHSKFRSKLMIDFSDVFRDSTPIEVEAHWAPIADARYNLHRQSAAHIELFDLSASQPRKIYDLNAFKAFLPRGGVNVGDTWELLDWTHLLGFLRQFHPSAKMDFTWSHGQSGAFGCLRAISSVYAEIVFRIHADIPLESIAHRAWMNERDYGEFAQARFSPGQFAGRLLLDLNVGTVAAFSFYLPDRNSNVDIWAFDNADMVFVPRMELTSLTTETPEQIYWSDAIDIAEAKRLLTLKFYKFAEIDWCPIQEVFARAEATQHPIQAIFFWGQLDDESC